MATIYLPVAAADVMGIANDWNTQAKTAGKAEFTIVTNSSTGFVKAGRRLIGSGALKLVPSTERLYVMIHGDGNDDENSFKVAGQRSNGNWKEYTPQELARHIEKEGLSKSHADLRLTCCNGGRLDANSQSYATVLKAWLVHLGYHNITVYGYYWEILNVRMQFADGNWRKITDIGKNGVEVNRRLKDQRVVA
jgi:hypothetical protein